MENIVCLEYDAVIVIIMGVIGENKRVLIVLIHTADCEPVSVLITVEGSLSNIIKIALVVKIADVLINCIFSHFGF